MDTMKQTSSSLAARKCAQACLDTFLLLTPWKCKKLKRKILSLLEESKIPKSKGNNTLVIPYAYDDAKAEKAVDSIRRFLTTYKREHLGLTEFTYLVAGKLILREADPMNS